MSFNKDIVQQGRSMIEMLGVLAIIGVLSVGGIAGYSKAMTKHKVNKTIDQITHIAANTRTLFRAQRNYGDLATNTSDIIDKAKLFPQEMKSGNSYKNPFGGTVTLTSAGFYKAGDNKAFQLNITGIPEDACVDLVTIDWSAGSNGGMFAMGIDTDISSMYNNDEGNSMCDWDTIVCGKKGAKGVDKAVTACNRTDNNELIFKFY